MFYTRPNLPQLGIDLVDAHGGGSCPSQFYGRTAAGRQIYMRYRGGWLAVWEGTDGDLFENELLSANIGPALDGDILLEQVCDLTGITIRGDKPSLTDAEWRAANEERPVMDWSGRTTYWIRDVLISKEGGERLADTLAAVFPDMMIVECVWLKEPFRRVFVRRKTIGECEAGVFLCFGALAQTSKWFGLGADARLLKRLTSGEQVAITDLDRLFAHILRIRIRWNEVRPWPDWRKALGLETPESERQPSHIELPNFGLMSNLRTKFATDDPGAGDFTRRLIETVDGCFSTWAEEVDLGTGAVVGAPREIRWYSLDLREWCEAAPNRFLFWRPPQEEGSSQKIGIRPCRAPA
jgi:hypothetical protein